MLLVLGQPVLVDADHRLAAGVDAGLGAGGRLLDAQLRAARRRSPWPCRRPARPPAMCAHARRGEVVGEPLDVVASRPTGRSPGSCRTPAAAAAGCCGRSGREKSVGSASASSRALVCSDWVWPWVAAIASTQVRTTLLKTSCAVSDQPEVWQCVRSDSDLRVLRLELLDQLRPQQPRRPQLRDLHEEVHADRPEERQPRRERVDVQPGVDAGAQVLDAVGERVGQLEVGGRPGLLDVVAGDGDRVELRHLAAR